MSETINQYLISSLNCLREFMDSDKESILKAFSLIEEAFDNGKKNFNLWEWWLCS